MKINKPKVGHTCRIFDHQFGLSTPEFIADCINKEVDAIHERLNHICDVLAEVDLPPSALERLEKLGVI